MTRRGQTLATLAVAAALAACAALVDNDYYLRILFMSCVYYLCAAGVNVLVGYAGQKSLGQAGLFAAGAYTAALLTSRWQVDPWLALAAAPVVAGVFGVLIALPSLRVKGPYLAMVTLAFGIVMEKIITEWVDVFGGPSGLFGILPPTWNGNPLSNQQWVWFALILCGHAAAAGQRAARALRPRAAVGAGRRDRLVVGGRAGLSRQGHRLRGGGRDLRHRRRAGGAAEPVHQLRFHQLQPVHLHPAAGAVRRRGFEGRAGGRRHRADRGGRAAGALAIRAALLLARCCCSRCT